MVSTVNKPQKHTKHCGQNMSEALATGTEIQNIFLGYVYFSFKSHHKTTKLFQF